MSRGITISEMGNMEPTEEKLRFSALDQGAEVVTLRPNKDRAAYTGTSEVVELDTKRKRPRKTVPGEKTPEPVSGAKLKPARGITHWPDGTPIMFIDTHKAAAMLVRATVPNYVYIGSDEPFPPNGSAAA